MFSVSEIIDLAIQVENNGESIYRGASEKVSQRQLASLLQWLADQEVEHSRWFVELKGKVKKSVASEALEEMAQNVLRGILGDQTFSLKDADFSKIEDVETLLNLAIEFEKDSILFYEMLAALVDEEETLGQLKMIIEEESRHVKVLQESLGRTGIEA
jgi:rubrerythrin